MRHNRRSSPLTNFIEYAVCVLLYSSPGLCNAWQPSNEEKAASAVQQIGGLIKRDESMPGNPVVEVSFQGSTTGRKIKDNDLAVLKGLHHLKVLYLGYVTDTSDAGLVHLKSLKSLEKLMLPDSKVTDAGLASLEDLSNLQQLGLVFCKGITDKGLVHLYRFKNLKELNLAGTRVTKEGIERLQKKLPKVYLIH